ncbi:MAG: outer membrane beta-barrel protein [bacterium]
MKKFILGIALFCSVIFASSGLAQEKKIKYSLGGGISTILTPDKFKDSYKSGLQVTVGIGYNLTSKLVIGGNLIFNSFGIDKQKLLQSTGEYQNPNTEIHGGTITIYQLLALASYYFFPGESSINFYVLGGSGLSVGKISEIAVLVPGQRPSVEEGSTETNFTLAGGLGVKFRVGSSTNLFVEGCYNVLISGGEDLTYVPVKLGVIF